jgi:hypothetical protein
MLICSEINWIQTKAIWNNFIGNDEQTTTIKCFEWVNFKALKKTVIIWQT